MSAVIISFILITNEYLSSLLLFQVLNHKYDKYDNCLQPAISSGLTLAANTKV